MFYRQSAKYGAALGAALLSGAARGDVPSPYAAQVGYALHLVEGVRYGEACDAAQALVDTAPNAAPSYEVRGTLALYVGNIARARDDFRVAASQAVSEPSVEYGLGLCALFGRHWDEAQVHLEAARRGSGLSPSQIADVDTARACLAYSQGNLTQAQALASPPGDDAVRVELLALIASHDRPGDGEAQLKAFLGTPSGAPRVREDEGVRILFDSHTPVEPSVTEPPIQQVYAARLADHMANAERLRGNPQTVSDTVTLTAQSTWNQASVVAFSVDGQVAAIVNQAPYTYSWDTTLAVNGWHTIQTEADDAAGRTLTTQTRTVRVQNARSRAVSNGHGTLSDVDYRQIQLRVWNLLRLRPSRKAAEWALADRLAADGDESDANMHRLVGAALDPNYRNGHHVARLLLGGTVRRVALASKSVHLGEPHPNGLWRGDPARRQVALTFDDGPNPLKTPTLLDALDKANAPATFFVVGSRAEAAPALLRRMAQRGDDVENHSYTHPNMDQAEPIIVEEEMLRTNVIIQALTGHMPHYFRPPGGNGGPSVLKLAREYGLTGAFWTEDALHYEDMAAPQSLVRYVVGHVHPGSIVLMHNGPDATISAVPQLVAALRAQGYQLVTLSQMARTATADLPPARPQAVKE